MTSQERRSLLIEPSVEKSIDEELFAELEKALGDNQEVYEMLTLDEITQREAAAALRRGENATLTPTRIDVETIQQRREQLRIFKRELLQDVTIDPDVKKIYHRKVNEEIATTHMLLAAQAGDLGKFDITNPRHIEILQKVGVLPS